MQNNYNLHARPSLEGFAKAAIRTMQGSLWSIFTAEEEPDGTLSLKGVTVPCGESCPRGFCLVLPPDGALDLYM